MYKRRKRIAAALISTTLILSNLASILPQGIVYASDGTTQEEQSQDEGLHEVYVPEEPIPAEEPAPVQAPAEENAGNEEASGEAAGAEAPADAQAAEQLAAAPEAGMDAAVAASDAGVESDAAGQEGSAALIAGEEAAENGASASAESSGAAEAAPDAGAGESGEANAVTIYYIADEGGSVSVPSEIVRAAEGGQALGSEAVAADGYTFTGWITLDGTVVCTDALFVPGVTPEMTGEVKYTAHFEKAAEEVLATRMVTAEYAAGKGGSVSRTSETVDALAEGAAFLGSTAAAEDGYAFVNWTAADGTEVSRDVTFVPAVGQDTAEKSVYTANFKKIITMPAQDFEGSVPGVTVHVHADEGRFPEGTTMHLASVSKTSILSNDSVQDAVGKDKEVVDAIAVDITFQNKDGKEIEPAGNISVSMFTSRAVSGESHQVLHIDDNGNASQVTNASADGASFAADSFSIYVITGSGDSQQPAVATYVFYGKDNETVISTQKVKSGETLYSPDTPVKAGYVFRGWATERSADKATVEPFVSKTIDTVSSTETISYYPVFEQKLYVFFMDKKGSDDKSRVWMTKEGTTGEKISISDVGLALSSTESVTGWYYDKELSQKVDENEITLKNDNITLWPKVETGHYLYFSTGKGASYIEPEFVAANSDTKTPADPKKPGYTFKFWTTDSSATSSSEQYTFGNILTDDLTLYAVWEAKSDTAYTVIYWKQSVNDSKDAKDDEKTYDYAASDFRQGKTGTTVSPNFADTHKQYTGFKYNSTKSSSVTIAGDGTTVLNVYYDRNLLTIEYYTWKSSGWWSGEWNVYKTYTGLYGQTLAQNGYKWPDKLRDNNKDYYVEWWNQSTTNMPTNKLTFLDAFIFDNLSSYGTSEEINLYAYQANGDLSINHYKQNLDGTSYSYDSPSNSTTTSRGTWNFTNKYTGFTIDSYVTSKAKPSDSSGWQKAKAGESTKFSDNLYIRYSRNKYQLAYYNYNTTTKTEEVLYEAPLSGYDAYKPTRPSEVPDVYTFQGWFKDKECTSEFDFGGTMPANHVIVYAKWAAPTYTGTVHLTIDGSGGVVNLEIPYRSTISQNDMPQVEQAENIIETGDGSKGTVTVPEGYDWAGWCTKDGDSYIRYNFDTEVTGDIELYPYWINKSGYSVTYNLNGGKGNAPEDSRKYAENSYADIMTAKEITAPKGKTFLYWGTKQDGTGEKAYPGGKLKVTRDITLYAIYGDTAAKTLLIYHANYPNGKEPEPKPIEKELDNNTAITLEEAGFKTPEGYYFAGWTQGKDGNGKLFVPGTQVGIDNNKQNQTIQNHLYAKWEELKVIELVAKSVTAIYDGNPHTAAGVVQNVFDLESGTYEVTGYQTSDPSSTDVCNQTNSISGTLKVTDSNGKDVTKQFKISTKDGKLTISKRPVTITSANGSWPYDGKTHSKEIATAETGENKGFVGNDGATYSNFNEIRDKGKAANTFDYKLTEGTNGGNYDIRQAYGQLEITAADEAHITITGNTDTQTYDGTEKTVSGYKTSELPAGITVSLKDNAKAEAKGTNADKYPMGLTEDSFDVVGTENYKKVTVTVNDGELTIGRRAVTITSANGSWPYDGEAHSAATATAEGFVGNDGATYSDFATIMNKGTTDNTFRYTLTEGTEGGNYEITQNNGQLEITAADEAHITITGNSRTEVYDGTEKSVSGFTTGELPAGITVSLKDNAKAEAKGTNAGEYAMGLTEGSFDVGGTENYTKVTVTVSDGKLTIGKRAVTFTSDSASKEYDGTALTAHHATIGGDGLAEGETAEFAFTGSQTEVGSSENRFTAKISRNIVENTNPAPVRRLMRLMAVLLSVDEDSAEQENEPTGAPEDNYDITYVYGTLTVTAKAEPKPQPENPGGGGGTTTNTTTTTTVYQPVVVPKVLGASRVIPVQEPVQEAEQPPVVEQKVLGATRTGSAVPMTGDDSSMGFYGWIALIAAAGMMGWLAADRKRRKNH
ncbi:MAG: InlB B-repeat-containing protein [Lachnospiraceae bacterium]|nr:InlB B-repeat-containing protein [Lachnospiraceae bacterium]